MGGTAACNKPWWLTLHHLTAANEALSATPPVNLIALSSITTCISIAAYQYGYSSILTFRRMVKWSYSIGYKATLDYVSVQIAKSIPWMRKQIDADIHKEKEKTRIQCEKDWNDLLDPSADKNRHLTLPPNKTSSAELLTLLKKWSVSESSLWDKGQASGAIYHGGSDLIDFLSKVYGLFCVSNPMHPELFPYVRKMEGEVVSMLIDIFSGDSNCCGTISSGGTESILLSCKAYRDRGRDLYNIKEPEIVAPTTIHAAFHKAAHYFGMKLVLVDIDEEMGVVNVDDMKRAITRNTVLIAASAPNYPHGIIEPIEELAALALKRNIGFHSDCCLGGLLLPFVDKLQKMGMLHGLDYSNIPLPVFDFRAKGVTSISADMHKYGYATKGSSCIMYSSPELRHYQYFVSLSWTGGIYASPTLAGSRAGGVSASTWAVMVHMGEEGYLEVSERIIRTARTIRKGIDKDISELEVIGNPLSSVIAFRSTISAMNIYGVGQALGEKGWHVASLQHPSCLHLCCTNLHTKDGMEKQFLIDLKRAVKDVKSHPEKYTSGTAAVYGMTHAIADVTLLDPVAFGYLDALFS
jgi:sphinganine-1-phosphate aldolase